MKRGVEHYYEKRAHTYCDLDERDTIVAWVRSIGIEDHLDIMRISSSERILDIGCGTGRFLLPFSKADVFGLDFSVNMLKKTKEIAPVVRGDAEHLPFKDSSFDKCHSAGLLAVYRSEKILEEAARVTRKGGRVFFSFPAADSVSGVVTRLFLKLGRNVSLFDEWYRRKDVEEMLPGQLRVVKITRLGFEPPFQRILKRVESRKLCRAFRYIEARLKNKWPFTYFSARHFLEAEKM